MKRETPLSGSGPPAREAAIRRVLGEATSLHGAQRYDDALRVLQADGGPALKTAAGRNIAGDVLLKQGKAREALKSFDLAIKLAPTAPEPHANRGVALQEIGRFDEALAAEDRALRLRPEYAMAHFNRGNILKVLGRFEEAATAYGRAIRVQPTLAEALLNRGLTLLALGRAIEAQTDFSRALGLRPNFADAHLGRANAYRYLGHLDEALAAIDAALALDAANFDARRMRCFALIDATRHAEALVEADHLIAARPGDASAHSARATALDKLQRYDDALVSANEAVRLSPEFAEAHTIRSIVLGDVGRLDDSLAAIEEARRLGASGAEYHHARALTLGVLGNPEEAAADFAQALALRPNDVTIHKNRAFFLLSTGDWEQGWAEHEWRLKEAGHAHARFLQWAPQWRGEDLTGKRILVYSEQGLGDTIQFVRYLPLLEKSGATAIRLAVPEAVRRLFVDNFPRVDVSDMVWTRPDADYQISLMSLPFVFGTMPDTLPGSSPYLFADEERKAKWRSRIGAEGFKVGIVWQGNPNYSRDRGRSIPLVAFAPLAAVSGVRLISLQSAVGAGQLQSLPAEMRVETLGEEVVANPDGFREVAAVMANLDLLVMSDTGPTHLAGALGRPTWLALSRYPDWRWMRDREDTPWYPTLRLFRQRLARDWAGVFERIAAELRARPQR